MSIPFAFRRNGNTVDNVVDNIAEWAASCDMEDEEFTAMLESIVLGETDDSDDDSDAEEVYTDK